MAKDTATDLLIVLAAASDEHTRNRPGSRSPPSAVQLHRAAPPDVFREKQVRQDRPWQRR